jgi:hypothetical protein
MIFNAGDTAYIIENGIRVKPVKILSRIGDMYTVRIGRGAICVRHTRLFATAVEAEKTMAGAARKRSGNSSPYDYWC